jgi:hypothetical protein
VAALEAALILPVMIVFLVGFMETGHTASGGTCASLPDLVAGSSGGILRAAQVHVSAEPRTILSTEQALPVLARDGAVLQVGIVRVLAGASGINVVARYDTGAGGRCVPHDPAVALPALSGVVGVFVVVQGCMPAQGSRVVGGGVLPTLYSSSVFALEFPMHAGDVKAP